MNIKLGYQVQPVMSVYQKLFSIACQARHRMFAGDLDITAKNLYMVVTMVTDYPDLADEDFDMKDLVTFLNILLEEAASVTEDEKQQLFVGGRLIQMAESLQVLASKDLLRLQETHAATVGVELIKGHPVSAKYKERIVSEVNRRQGRIYTGSSGNSKARIKRSSSNGDRDTWCGEVIKGVKTYEQQRLQQRPNEQHKRPWPIVTQLLRLQLRHGLAPTTTETLGLGLSSSATSEPTDDPTPQMKTDEDGHLLQRRNNTNSPILLTHADFLTTKNKTHCLSWEGWTRELPTGQWVSSSCVVVQAKPNLTTCLCPLPGHLTAIMMPSNFTVMETGYNFSQRSLLIICGLSLACLILALIVYLVKARCLLQSKHLVHFNLILSVAGVNLVCVLCLMCQDTLMMCAAGKVILQFFIVSAFTFLMLDSLGLFLDIHARTHTRMTFSITKFLVIGWGLPAVSVICGVLVMEASAHDEHCQTWCWWTTAHYHFYTVLVPLAILMVGHTVFVAMSVVLMYNWQDEWGDSDRRKSIVDIARGECLLLLLTAFSLVSTTMTSEPTDLKLLSVVILNVLLMRMAVLSLFCLAKDPEEKNVFPGFMAPGIPSKPSSHAELEAQKIHDYCETVDRERYTNEHKRQLRTLIRSSSSAGSFSAGAFSAPLGLTTCSTGPRLAASKTCDSAAEAMSFSKGNKRRQKLPSTGSASRLRPEPSISRLLDSDYSKPVVENRSLISGGIAEEEISPNHTSTQSFVPLPMAQKSFINRDEETQKEHKSELSKSNTHLSVSAENKRTRSKSHLNSAKGLFIGDKTNSGTSDVQKVSSSVDKTKEDKNEPKSRRIMSISSDPSCLTKSDIAGEQKECESLLKNEANSEML
ncbi:adhesion G protein-coupled receptor L3 [Elysia marginata]|uniref:Adhesion G protein-coupled receptor L3 n=1 Tax=Elysia marginata TaxID=1093978 RepID=A0AAV4G4L2_9GAST|nr:adhesion G protein-coupled receptor L3 [Elysia marginata]